jgi:hypothetical protein
MEREKERERERRRERGERRIKVVAAFSGYTLFILYMYVTRHAIFFDLKLCGGT